MGGKHQMKHLFPIMVILLLVSTSFVGVGNQVEELMIYRDKKKSIQADKRIHSSLSVIKNDSVDGFNIIYPVFTSKKENHHSKDNSFQFSTNNFLAEGKVFFGYQVYPNPDVLVSFKSNNPENLTSIGSPISPDKIAGATWVDGVWRCCEYSAENNSTIWIIDHLTGDMVIVGPSGVGLHGLAYDDTTNIMYGCGSTNLYIVDIATGEATLVGSFGISGCIMIGIACDSNGNMFGEDLHTDSLYSINSSTGTATLIGSLGLDLNHGQDMAIDKENNICYLAAFTVHDGDEGALYKCNLSSGITTKIGNFGSVPTQITGFVIPYRLNNPPESPIITGRICGEVGVEYEYTFNSTDDGDDFYYYVDWGDCSPIEFVFPSNPGQSGIAKANHSWDKKGNYIVRAKARDTFGAESDWAYFKVTMPYTYNQFLWLNNLLDRFLLLQRLLGLLIR